MAHLLIIELPGGNDIDILQAAIDRGDEFTFLSARLDHYSRQPAVNTLITQASHVFEVPSFSYDEVELLVLNLHDQHPIDAVLCLIDIRLIEASKLAKTLGLRYLNPDSARLLRDKYSVRCRLAERGLIQPQFELAQTNDELKQAVSRLGLPVLIKPADGYGSQNIVVLRSPEDLEPWISPLENMLPSRADYGLGVMANDRLLVERYLQGKFIGCDTLTVNGQHRLLGINEKLMFEPPSFAIKGGCFTPNGTELSEIENYVFAVLDAVEFDWGATHIEMMLTDDGPRIIEINPRLVGAKIGRLVSLALGRSVHQDLIDVHLGFWPDGMNSPASNQVAVTRWMVAPHAGILEKVELPHWTDPKVRSVELFKRPGDLIHPPFENTDRIGCVMACGSSRAETERVAQRFVDETKILLK